MKKTEKAKRQTLERYNALCARISRLEERYAELWLGSIVSPPCTDKTPAGAPDGTKTERFIEKSTKLEADIKKLCAKRDNLKENLEAAISGLADMRQQEVIRAMYLSGEKVNAYTLAERMHYSARHIRRLCKKALEKLEI